MLRLGFAAVLLLSLLPACAIQSQAQTSSSAAKPDLIEGTVLNTLTHEPVGRALVYSPDNRFAALTDARGRFEFKFPSNDATNAPIRRAAKDPDVQAPGARLGPVSLMVRKPGFLPPRSDVLLAPDQTEVSLYLVPESLIIGQVTVATSDGSDKIQVHLYRREIQDGVAHWIPAASTATRADGRFRFADLPAGTYKIFTSEQLDRDPLTFDPRGQIYGYPPVYFPSAANFNAAAPIELASGRTQQVNLTPGRRPYYPVELNVMNVPAPAQGYDLSVFLLGQPGPGYSLSYDVAEQKIQGSLPDGVYIVELTAFGAGAASGSASITINGAPVRGQIINMIPNAPIRVNVTTEFTSQDAGRPESPMPFEAGRDLQVWLQAADDFAPGQGGSLRHAAGGYDPSLLIDNVKPGRYWVRSNSPRGYVARAESGGTDLLRQPLIVPAGASVEPIELTLRDDGAEIDIVVDGLTAPSEVCLVPVFGGPGQFRSVWSPPDGHISFGQIPPGDYRVMAFDTQREIEYRNEQAMSKYASSGEFVRLLPGQKQHLRLRAMWSE